MISTTQELMRFYTAGDADADPEWFFRQVGVEPEAAAGLCAMLGSMLRIHPATVMTIMELGMRLGLQAPERTS